MSENPIVVSSNPIIPANPMVNPNVLEKGKKIQLYTSYYAYFKKNYAYYPVGLPLLVTSTSIDRFLNEQLREKLDVTYQRLLMPSIKLVKNYHARLVNQEDAELIQKDYTEEYLASLEVRFKDYYQNFQQLFQLIIHMKGAVFFCYEKAFTFCHRYILVEWLAEKLANHLGAGSMIEFREFEVKKV